MKIYPAVDILDGKCVRLVQGRYDKVTSYAANPTDMAKKWEAEGSQILHIVDLDGATEGRPKNLSALEEIVDSVNIPIQFGGGVRDLPTLEMLLEMGIERVVLGTSLINSPKFVEEACPLYGDRIAAGLDARGGKVAISGWQEKTGVSAVELAKKLDEFKIARIILTDIAVDGTQAGPNLELLREVTTEIMTPIIASGGVSSIEDIIRLKEFAAVGVEGVIIGRALYEKSFTLGQALEAAKGKR